MFRQWEHRCVSTGELLKYIILFPKCLLQADVVQLRIQPALSYDCQLPAIGPVCHCGLVHMAWS